LNHKIILASKSPRRKQLLELLGLSFRVQGSNIDEVYTLKNPEEIVTHLAESKAHDVARQVDEGLIIGADTIVVLDGQVLEKPGDEKDAFDMLMRLSNRTHSVYTGVCLILKTEHSADEYSFFEETKVTFAPLTETEVRSYIRSGSPMDKAGAYGIQDDYGAVFVKRIEGDYYNVVGFPLHAFYQKAKTLIPDLFEAQNKS
jgi:septum formation protein